MTTFSRILIRIVRPPFVVLDRIRQAASSAWIIRRFTHHMPGLTTLSVTNYLILFSKEFELDIRPIRWVVQCIPPPAVQVPVDTSFSRRGSIMQLMLA